jgi:hypothetical protein
MMSPLVRYSSACMEGRVMKPPVVRRLLAAVVVACSVSASGLAQSERVPLRVTPQPNQVVRIGTDSEMDVLVEVDSASPAGLAGPMRMTSTNVMRVTQKSGAANDQGQITAELTFDEMSDETLLNGQPLPVGIPRPDLAGKTITVVFDRDGGVVDAVMPAGGGVPEAQFKQMLKTLYGNLPATSTSIGIGETATAPIDLAFPMGVPGAGQLKWEGDTKYTLVSIQRDAEGHFARFNVTTNGKMASSLALAAGQQGLSWVVTMAGNGSMILDLDRGLMRSSELQVEVSGSMKPTGDSSSSPVPALAMHGTVKTTTTSGN